MSAWITDRLPGEGDGDIYGYVYVQYREGVVTQDLWRLIQILGTPWQPITYPEPYVKPKKWRITEDGIFKYDRRMYSWDDLRADERAVMEDALNRLEEGV